MRDIGTIKLYRYLRRKFCDHRFKEIPHKYRTERNYISIRCWKCGEKQSVNMISMIKNVLYIGEK